MGGARKRDNTHTADTAVGDAGSETDQRVNVEVCVKMTENRLVYC